MTDQAPLDEEAPDSRVSKYQKIEVFEVPERDYPQHGSIMLKLQHSERQSTSIQLAKRTAESLRDHLNAMLPIPADTVNSIAGLEALPVGSVFQDFNNDIMQIVESQAQANRREVREFGWSEFAEDLSWVVLPATVLYRPEASDD